MTNIMATEKSILKMEMYTKESTKEGLWNGYGELYTKNGDVYKGEFKDHK